jgi:hypothetical protein
LGKDLYRRIAPASFFARPDWWDAAAGDWRCAAVVDDNGLAAAFPYVVRKKWGLRFIEQPPLTPRIPVYFRDAVGLGKKHELLARLIASLPPYDRLVLSFHPSLDNCSAFHWAGMTLKTRYTQIIDPLTEDPAKKFAKDARRNYEKSDLLTTLRIEAPNAENAAHFYQLMQTTFARRESKIPFTFDWFAGLYLSNAARSSFSILAADENAFVYKMRWYVYDHETLYALASGQDTRYRNRVVNEKIHWTAMQKARELGLKRLDFLGSMLKGVEATQRKMGAVSVPYTEVVHIPHRGLRLWWAWRG